MSRAAPSSRRSARARRGTARGQGALDSARARLQGPVRTCVGCRVREPKPALLRVVVVGDPAAPRLAPDPAGRMPGRGASVHLDPRCVDLADKRRAFPRALRLDGPLDVTPVREHVAERCRQAEPS